MPTPPQPLDALLESLLFAAGEGLSIERLAKLTGKTASEVRLALDELSRRLTCGIRLVLSGTTAALVIAPGNEKVISELIGDPESREIGQAGLEVLAILLYQGPSTRSTIDYVRGVNSSSSIKTLLMRALIERDRSEDSREILYRPTIALMEHLGLVHGNELPDAVELRTALKTFIKRQGNGEKEPENHGIEPTTA